MKTVRGFYSILSFLLVALGVHAANVPEGFAATRYESLWKRSPFTLSSIADEQGAPTSAIAERYSLGGAYTVGTDDYIFVINRANPMERFLVSKEVNAQGIILQSIAYNRESPDKTTAIIKQGEESGPIGFDPALLKAATVNPNPGMPGNVPGQPPRTMPTYNPPSNPGQPQRVIRRPRIIAPPPGTTPTRP